MTEKKETAMIDDDLDFLDAESEHQAAGEKVLDDLNALEAEAIEEEKQPVSEEEAAAASSAAALEDESYLMGAKMAVGFVSQLVSMRWQGVTVPAEGQAEIATKLAPVMRKHGGGLPDWLLPYQEEVALGMAVAGVAFGVAMQARMQKAKNEAEKEAKPKPAQPAAGANGGKVNVSDNLSFLQKSSNSL